MILMMIFIIIVMMTVMLIWPLIMIVLIVVSTPFNDEIFKSSNSNYLSLIFFSPIIVIVV